MQLTLNKLHEPASFIFKMKPMSHDWVEEATHYYGCIVCTSFSCNLFLLYYLSFFTHHSVTRLWELPNLSIEVPKKQAKARDRRVKSLIFLPFGDEPIGTGRLLSASKRHLQHKPMSHRRVVKKNLHFDVPY